MKWRWFPMHWRARFIARWARPWLDGARHILQRKNPNVTATFFSGEAVYKAIADLGLPVPQLQFTPGNSPEPFPDALERMVSYVEMFVNLAESNEGRFKSENLADTIEYLENECNYQHAHNIVGHIRKMTNTSDSP